MENDITYIDRFLGGQLDEEELIALKQRREADEEFNSLVLEMISLKQVIREETLKNKLKLFQEIEQPRVVKPRFGRWYAVAASVLVIVVGVWSWDIVRENNRVDGIMATYEHYPSNVLTRGAPLEKERQDAYVLYEARRYKDALPHFEKILVEGNRSDSLYYGLTLVGAREFEEASNILDGLSDDDSDVGIRNEIKQLINQIINQ